MNEMKSKIFDKTFASGENTKLALIAEANPGLPPSFIQDILEAEEERKAGLGVPFLRVHQPPPLRLRHRVSELACSIHP